MRNSLVQFEARNFALASQQTKKVGCKSLIDATIRLKLAWHEKNDLCS